MRTLVMVFALLGAYIAGTLVVASMMGDSRSGTRYVLSLLVAALVSATVYTAMRDGPRGVRGVLRRRGFSVTPTAAPKRRPE